MDARGAALAALAQFQVTDTSVGQALQQIADITVDALPAVEIAGMSMMGADGQPTTAIYTDPESPEIDEGQYRDGKGPCLDAWRHNKVFHVRHVEDCSEMYPGFAASCLEHGVHSTLSLPMSAGDVAVGAMNLYARIPDGFSDDDESLALDIAAAAGAVLANVSAYWTAFELTQRLNEAMDTRAVIEQAKGVLMATSPGLTAEAAFERLRRIAQDENATLQDVAARIVGRRSAGLDESSGR